MGHMCVTVYVRMQTCADYESSDRTHNSSRRTPQMTLTPCLSRLTHPGPSPPPPPPQAIEDGTLSVVSSDHSPAPPADKLLEEGDFLRAWGGISSLQFSLPATWTKMSKLGMDFVKLAGE